MTRIERDSRIGLNEYAEASTGELPRYRLIKDLLPIGSELSDRAATKSERYGDHYEVLIGIGNDGVAYLTVDAEAVQSHPEYFELIDESAA